MLSDLAFLSLSRSTMFLQELGIYKCDDFVTLSHYFSGLSLEQTSVWKPSQVLGSSCWVPRFRLGTILRFNLWLGLLKYKVTKSTWGSNAYTQIFDDTRSKRRPDIITRPTTDLVCTCSKISPRKDSGNMQRCWLHPRCTSAKKPHHIRQLSLAILHVSQVFPNFVGRISFTWYCP